MGLREPDAKTLEENKAPLVLLILPMPGLEHVDVNRDMQYVTNGLLQES